MRPVRIAAVVHVVLLLGLVLFAAAGRRAFPQWFDTASAARRETGTERTREAGYTATFGTFTIEDRRSPPRGESTALYFLDYHMDRYRYVDTFAMVWTDQYVGGVPMRGEIRYCRGTQTLSYYRHDGHEIRYRGVTPGHIEALAERSQQPRRQPVTVDDLQAEGLARTEYDERGGEVRQAGAAQGRGPVAASWGGQS